MRQRKISFIIVSYNTCELLDKCIDNLDMIFKNMEIIVVDNNSTDGSREMVKEKWSDKVILVESENKGLAHGHNLGLRIASGYYVVYLGTDAYPTEKAINKIYDYMEHNTFAAVVTPRLVMRDGTVDKDAHRGFPTPWNSITHFSGIDTVFPESKLLSGYFMSYENYYDVHEIDACICHFMFVRKSIHDIIGWWDERYFLYGEDIDFCYRVKQAGYKIMYLGDVEVLHYKGAGVGRKSSIDLKTASSMDKKHLKKIRSETTKAMRIFYKTHYREKYPLLLTSLVLLGIFLLDVLRITVYNIKVLLKLESSGLA